MTHSSATYRSHCPINFVLETFGDRWTLLIIRDLMFMGKHSFGEFMASDEGISTNILTERLKRLEANGIVVKAEAPENRSKFLYSLTPKGSELLPIMLEVTAWSAKHDPHTNTPPRFLEEWATHRDAMLAALSERV